MKEAWRTWSGDARTAETPAPEGIAPCDCPTNVVYDRKTRKTRWKANRMDDETKEDFEEWFESQSVA